ncbi:MAG: cyclic nucleotide-binding domain-containing protein [Longimicrobiales bacterium]
MTILDRLLPDYPEDQKAERHQLLGLMGMFFLVVTAVGILKPVRNSLALSGLGDGEFYRVYLVSAVVLLFVPFYNRLADRVGWGALVPAMAVFFGLNLVVFRFAYTEGSTLLGLVFYGWYDLFAAALVTQFFVATQLLLNARSAKSAYPLVIGGGALGAMLGGGIAGFLAEAIGTPNLLLLGAVCILGFGLGIPLVWPGEEITAVQRQRSRGVRRKETLSKGEVRRLLGNSHVRLIAVSVLIVVLAKQLVDYEFNTLTKQIFVTEDAVTEFQGYVNLATQWLPLVSVVALRPLLKRWGLGAIVFILPGLIFLSSFVAAAFFSIWTVIAVRTSDTMFRYSAERASREILYVPIPEEIKLKAKTYIDVGVEKGLGKALAAGVIALLVEVLHLGLEQIAWVVVAMAAAWVGITILVRREYVRTLARSIRGRFASFQGLSALSDASTQEVVRRSLRSDDPVQVSFALDLVDQSAGTDTRPVAEALHELLEHSNPDIRHKALRILTEDRDPDSVDPERVQPRLRDRVRRVREQAVLALLSAAPDRQKELVRGLLASPHSEVRTAALAVLARGDVAARGDELLGASFLDERWEQAQAGHRDARVELALAAGVHRSHPRAVEVLEALLGDPDPVVASAALRSAGLLDRTELRTAMVEGLKKPGTRQAARDALVEQGQRAVECLADALLDESSHPTIRRHIPSVLARMPNRAAADAMLHSVVAPETDQLLDYRTLKALSQIRTRDPSLEFDREMVMASIRREVEAAVRYHRARRCIRELELDGRATSLLRKSLTEAWSERREGVFRLLGLLYPSDEMYRVYLAISSGERTPRANAIEWLEETLDRGLFQRIAPVLGETAPLDELDPFVSLGSLLRDGDPWIARTAVAATAEIEQPWSRAVLHDIIGSESHGDAGEQADRRLRRATASEEGTMDLIEKVFLLQKIDLLQDARSAHLALLASIAEEVEADPGTVLIRQDEPTEALYMVIDGRVDLEGVAGQQLEAGDSQAFGTWALIDEAPSLVTATVDEPSRLLRITRSDFYDLLADHPELALGLLQGLARRVRTLVA